MAVNGTIKQRVRNHYGQAARRALADSEEQAQPCCGDRNPQLCCSDEDTSKAVHSGYYDEADLAVLPHEIGKASWGSGNPVAFADLRPGEVVLDLGSGGGLDALLAAHKVGPQGRVIGVDMTPEMLSLAWKNAAKAGVANVDFRRGELENLPLPDASVDAVISNCVINLSPDKDKVLAEAFRVLRAGGRFVVSDIVLVQPLPDEARQSVQMWCDCVAGALQQEEFLLKAEQAGFADVHIVTEGSREYIPGTARSVLVRARKPA